MSFELPVYHHPDFAQPCFTAAPDARWQAAERDGVAPDDFHSTSMYPEYFKLDGQWFLCCSPQGVPHEKKRFQNTYSCGFFPLSGDFRSACTLGAFIELAPGKDGMCHIKDLEFKRTEKVEDVLNIGDMTWVKVMEIDEKGRVNLSRKDALKELAAKGQE